MPTIFMSGKKPGQLLVLNPDAGARTGRWCAALPGLYPDLCHRCFDSKTMAHYPATAFVTVKGSSTEANPSGLWREGRCRRCSRLPIMKPYRKGSARASRIPPRTCDPSRHDTAI